MVSIKKQLLLLLMIGLGGRAIANNVTTGAAGMMNKTDGEPKTENDDVQCPDPKVLLEPLKEFIEKAQKNGTLVPALLKPLMSPSKRSDL